MIIHDRDFLTYAEAPNVSELIFKYPDTVIVIIPLTDDFIKAVKEDDFVPAYYNA